MTIKDLLVNGGVAFAPESHRLTRIGWVNLDCPWCGKGTGKYHLGLNTRGDYFNCWKCGPLNKYNVLSTLLKVDERQLTIMLAGIEKSEDVIVERIKGTYTMPKRVRKLQAPHIKYLKRRGFNVKQLSRLWQIKGIGIDNRLPWRIWIPIMKHGQAVSWTTRSIDADAELRYVTANPEEEEIHHKDLLYGEDFCRTAIVICEGPFDAWKIGPGAVATLGTSYTTAQVETASKYITRAVCFDSERAAQRRAAVLCDSLSLFAGEVYNIKLDSADAGQARTSEIRKIRKHIFGEDV